MNGDQVSSFFQVGFVCRDLDKAIGHVAGVDASVFLIIDVVDNLGVDDAPVKRMALANLGRLNIELIEVADECPPFFADALASDGSPGFHHHGYLVSDAASWDRLQELSGGDDPPVMAGEVPGALRYAYFDRREDLGHHIEFIFLEEGGKALFESLPSNRLAPTFSGDQT